MIVGLRIDVDTLRGTRVGAPELLAMLDHRGLRASFFFSVGPDNMGRHLLRLLKPRFAAKMLRTRAARLYGWDIVLRGTVGPGPNIGDRCASILRACRDSGHEIGLHAWDHHHWQRRADRMGRDDVVAELRRGADRFAEILGAPPTCFAAPGWKAGGRVIEAEAALGFRYASDCRGREPFQPLVDGRVVGPPQVPVTLPTYDEIVGRHGRGASEFVTHVLGLLRDDRPNVLAVHAEVEGIVARSTMTALLDGLAACDARVLPLGDLVPDGALPVCGLDQDEISGREGSVALQGPARLRLEVVP